MTRWLTKTILHAFVLVGTSMLCAPLSAGEPAPSTSLDLRLIAFNDFHGYLAPPDEGLPAPDPQDASKTSMLKAGGAANFAALVRQLQAGHPLNAIVAAGDLVGASPFESSLFHDEPTIAFMNAIGLRFSAVGNHEFDHGREELLRLQQGGCRAGGLRGRDTCIGSDFGGARFHYLAANVIDVASQKPLFAPYEIETFATPGERSLRIGFIGLVLKNTGSMVLPSGVAGLQFRDEAATANALVPQLRAQGVDAIVLLIHQGGSTSGSFNDHGCRDFSGALLPILDALDPAIRVVVSGHTHQAYICRRGDRLITSAGSYGRLLTAIDLHFDGANGRLQSVDADNYPVVDPSNTAGFATEFKPPRAAMLASVLGPYERISEPLGARVIGHLSAALLRAPNAAGESTLGDVVADSMLAAAHADGAVIAFTNSGGLRQDLIPQSGNGAITYAQLFAALPFGNRLVAMDLSGAQIRALLRERPRFPQFRPLQVSRGFSYDASALEYSADAPIRLQGEPVKADKIYRVVVNEYLAEGGDGFHAFENGRSRRTLGGDLDAMLAYFSKRPVVMPAAQDRIHCESCVGPGESEPRERR